MECSSKIIYKFLIFVKNLDMLFTPHKIKKVLKETSSSVSLYFDNIENFQFLPGQYLTFEQDFEGKTVRRSYSLSSAPNEDLRVGIKAVENGLFSNFALGLKEGDSLNIAAPEGRFLLDLSNTNKAHFLGIAAGSGITPIMSMIKEVLKSKEAQFTLIYGNKRPEDAMYLSELLEMQKEDSRLKIHLTYSQNCGPEDRLGRIDENLIKFALKDQEIEKAFLCGPEKMIENASSVLEELEFAPDQISYELFTQSSQKDEVLDESDSVEITVILDDESHTFSAPKGQNLLDAILEEDLDAPYSCKGGVCSSCIALVSKGKAEMLKNPILTDSEIEEGLTLTCMAHAVTSSVCIDFDEA